MIVCPYCKSNIKKEPEIPKMSARMLRVYKAVVEAGPDGIHPQDLLVKMYAEAEWPTPGGGTVLRVQIHEINKLIGVLQQRIVGCYFGNYRIITTKERVDGQEV